ncbi:MAG: hypothetical protein ACU0A9_12985 [Alterinioella nitratireducens]|uniref:hypothetical protein n=1 Tax=Alterinioella nitratireducens TaxID=2735915 RepID=UPI0040584096
MFGTRRIKNRKTDPAMAAQDLMRPEFDAKFYLETNPDVAETGADPLAHFAQHGWREGRDPNATFSTRHYLEAYPDVAQSGLNPYLHYLMTGRDEGRAPVPAPEDATQEVLRAGFDAAFYLETYPDVAETGADPLAHFAQHGWREGRDPNATFSTRHYLEAYPDVAQSGLNPYLHYLTEGRDEGREPAPAPAPDPEAVAQELLRAAFDADFYLSSYPDVAEAGFDPLDHFPDHGWQEGRDPNPDFTTRYYADSNPDVVQSGLNPYLHYLMAGQAEGRPARHPAGYKATMLRDLKTPDEVAEAWQRADTPPAPLAPEDLRPRIAPQGRALVLSFSHDNYQKVSGGIQLCVQREEAQSVAAGLTYLNLHPWQPLPYLARAHITDPLLCLVLDGAEIGTARMSDLTRAVQEIGQGGTPVHLVIHSLLGHSPEAISALVGHVSGGACLFWLHDFVSICPSFTLQRNTVTYCGAPDIGSPACALCSYGAERADHAPRIARLFDAFDMQVLAPSEHTAALWTRRAGLPHAGLRVAPHIALDWHDQDAATDADAAPQDPVRVAFVGFPAPHKGWQVFTELARQFGDGGAYEFWYFGTAAAIPAGIRKVPVQVSAEDRNAMTDAMAEAGIDLMLHWASWPETFSFSTYEALAAQAHVITNTGSGNVADTVTRLERGSVLDSRADLTAFFEDGRAAELGHQARARRAVTRCTAVMSDMSVPFLTGADADTGDGGAS